jgi:hypothetical protein
MLFRIERYATLVQVDKALQQKISRYDALFTAFDIPLATHTQYLNFPIFVFNLTSNLIHGHIFLNVITCPFSKTISCNKPDMNILCNNEDIAIFVKMTLTFVQGQGKEIGYNLLHNVC